VAFLLRHQYPPVTASHLQAVSCAASSPPRALHSLLPLILQPATHHCFLPVPSHRSILLSKTLSDRFQADFIVSLHAVLHTPVVLNLGADLLPPLPPAPARHLAMSGNAVARYDLGGGRVAPGLLWVETRDAAKCPRVHRTAP